MLKTVEAVRERERESYSLEKKVTLKNKAQAQNYVNNSICWTVWRAYSREISFICCAQNTVLAGIRKIDLIDNIKDGLYSNIKVVM